MDRWIETFSRLDYRMDDMIVETREYITGSRWLALAAWWEQWARWREEFRSRWGFYLADSSQGKFCGLWASYLISTDAVDGCCLYQWTKKILETYQIKLWSRIGYIRAEKLDPNWFSNARRTPARLGKYVNACVKKPQKHITEKPIRRRNWWTKKTNFALHRDRIYRTLRGVEEVFFGTTFFSWNQILNVERNDFFSRTFF